MTILQLEVVLLPAENQSCIQLLHNVLEVDWSAPLLQARLLLLATFLDQPGNLGLRVAWRPCWLPGGHLDHLLLHLLQQLGTGLVPGEHHHLAQGLPTGNNDSVLQRVKGKS